MDTSQTQQNRWSHAYANDPLAPAAARHVARDVRAYLDEASLQFAIPEEIVALESLPRAPDGALDVARLPRVDAPPPVRVEHAAPGSSIESTLVGLWREILEVDVVGRHDNFFDLGGDSMRGMQVVAHARRCGIDLELRQIMEHQTIAELAAAVSHAATPEARAGKVHEPPIVSGEIPLPIPHKRLIDAAGEDFFLERIYVYRFACRRLLRAEALAQAIEYLVSHHDALRVELRRTASGVALWNAECARPMSELLWTFDLSPLPDAERAPEIDAISSKLRDASDLPNVSMIRFALIDLGPAEPQMLLVAAHHAVWDPVTAGIFLEDLRTAYDQAARGRELRLPPKTSSLKLWAGELQANGPSLAADEIDYWREKLSDEALVLPLDGAPTGAGAFSGISEVVAFTSQETRAILEAMQEDCEARFEEILLAAVGMALTKWTGKPRTGVNLLHHGRDGLVEGVDVSRTVGWFSTDYPVILDLSGVERVLDAVTNAKNAVRQVPRNGVGYTILRYLHADRPLAAHAPPRIMLNHFGAGSVPANGPLRYLGLDQSVPPSKLMSLSSGPIQIMSRIHRGALDITWTSNETVVSRTTVRALAESTASALRQLIVECGRGARRTRVERE